MHLIPGGMRRCGPGFRDFARVTGLGSSVWSARRGAAAADLAGKRPGIELIDAFEGVGHFDAHAALAGLDRAHCAAGDWACSGVGEAAFLGKSHGGLVQAPTSEHYALLAQRDRAPIWLGYVWNRPVLAGARPVAVHCMGARRRRGLWSA